MKVYSEDEKLVVYTNRVPQPSVPGVRAFSQMFSIWCRACKEMVAIQEKATGMLSIKQLKELGQHDCVQRKTPTKKGKL